MTSIRASLDSLSTAIDEVKALNIHSAKSTIYRAKAEILELSSKMRAQDFKKIANLELLVIRLSMDLISQTKAEILALKNSELTMTTTDKTSEAAKKLAEEIARREFYVTNLIKDLLRRAADQIAQFESNRASTEYAQLILDFKHLMTKLNSGDSSPHAEEKSISLSSSSTFASPITQRTFGSFDGSSIRFLNAKRQKAIMADADAPAGLLNPTRQSLDEFKRGGSDNQYHAALYQQKVKLSNQMSELLKLLSSAKIRVCWHAMNTKNVLEDKKLIEPERVENRFVTFEYGTLPLKKP